jgi:thiamine-phosphate pyrophosphorylase
MQAEALAIRSLAPPNIKLIMNDRADFCLAAHFDGVHLGQNDLSIDSARKICPAPMIVGVSTHNPQQVSIAEQTSADYIAIGPVFSTSSKANPDPVVGLDGIRAARKLTQKPLVAIGGITLENCREVIDAGADSVAIIRALLPAQDEPCDEPAITKRVGAFLRVLG